MSSAAAHRQQVLGLYRSMISLIRRLPSSQSEAALKEARQTLRERKGESDPRILLDNLKEMSSKIGFLRITAPRRPGDIRDVGGHYVLRDGALQKGSGIEIGGRVATGGMSMEEGMARNSRDFRRLYGAEKPKGRGPFF
eukprot:gene12637-15869_t